MLTSLKLDCDQNSYLHRVFGVRGDIAAHFQYVVSWEEKLHLSATIAFPPVVFRK